MMWLRAFAWSSGANIDGSCSKATGPFGCCYFSKLEDCGLESGRGTSVKGSGGNEAVK